MSQFANAYALWSLAALPALAALALWSKHRREQLIPRLGPPGVIASQTARPAGRLRSGIGWTLGLVMLAVGAAGPRWGMGAPPATAAGRDIVIVLDLSKSMLAQDALPSRLGKAKEGLRELADAVQARGGHRLALVGFAGQAAVVVPLTHDYDHFRAKLADLSADPPPSSMRGGTVSGTRIGAGLQKAVELLDPQHRGAQEIILVSDGDDPADDEEWRTGLAAAREAGVPVNVIGIGDPDRDSPILTANGRLQYQGTDVRTRLHEPALREIASRTGGTYITAHTGPPAIEQLFRERIANAPTREAVAGTLPQPVGRQLVFLSLALAMIVGAMATFNVRATTRRIVNMLKTARIGRPATVAAALVVVSAAAPANWMQRGNDFLARGQPEAALSEYARAVERTDDPGQVAFDQGVALFRLGRFRDAEVRFRQALSDARGQRRVRALYNLGSALLQESQGRLTTPLRAAVASFEQALDEVRSGDPLADDIRHNLELAKRLLSNARTTGANQPDEPPDSARPNQPPTGVDKNLDPEASGREPVGAQLDPSGKPRPIGKADSGPTPQTTDRPPPPGKGHLPPLPDEDALSLLSPDDAQAHLQRAADRIAAERKAQLQRTAPPPATKFQDW